MSKPTAGEITVEIKGVTYRGTYYLQNKILHVESRMATKSSQSVESRSRHLRGWCCLNLLTLPRS